MAKNDPISIINQHIKTGEFSRLYLLFGNEEYLVRQFKETLVSTLISNDDTMNFSLYKGDHCDVKTILNDAETMPFFSDRRVILVEDSGFFNKANDMLADGFETIPDTTVLIFCEKNVDKRLRTYKALAKSGTLLEFETPDEATLLAWLKKRLKSDGCSVDDAAVYKLLEATGSDMNRLQNEAEKLKSYCFEKKRITAADVEQLCVSQIENKVFDMTDAIAQQDTETALRLYNDLLMLREPAMRVLYLITRHYNILLQIKKMLEECANQKRIAAVVKIPPFAVKKYTAQCKNETYQSLLAKAESCLNADFKIKSGQITDQNAVEMLIIELVHPKEPSARA